MDANTVTTVARTDTLGHILPGAAARFGSKTALVSGARSLSFSELNGLSNSVCEGLRHLGIGAGDRVTLYAPNSWEWVVGYYAVAKLGAVINPVNVMLTAEEIQFIVSDCGAKAVLAGNAKGELLMDIKGRSPLEQVIVFGEDVPAGATSFNALMNRQDLGAMEPASAAESLGAIMYTSGTTGYPKGAMLTHAALWLNGAMTANMHVRTSADTVVTGLPMPHVYGSAVLNASLISGSTLVLLERFSEHEALRAISTHRATLFEGVPTMYLYLLNHPQLAQHDISSLTRCTVGGQTMPVTKMQEVEDRFGCPLLELWGMTEIAGLGTTHPFYGRNRLGSIGVPLPYVDCRIVDAADTSKILGTHEIGELMVSGPIVMQGYFGNEEATRETIEPSGWLHTGDLARMDPDGYLYVVDRKKDMSKLPHCYLTYLILLLCQIDEFPREFASDHF